MPAEIRVPEFGESVVEATVGHWLKSEGEQVSAGEAVVELETEKVNTEVASVEDGVIAQILHKESDTVHPGDVLAVVTEAGAEAPAAQPAQAQAPPQALEAAAPPACEAAPPAPEAAGQVEEARPAEAERTRVSPAAQRLAEELGVDLARVKGTGPGGRVMKEDVEAFKKQGAPVQPEAPAPAAPPTERPAAAQPQPGARAEIRARMSRRRLTIARRLVEAQQTAAMLTTFNEADMSAVMDLRKRRRETFKEWTGVDLGFMPFFVKAVIGALKKFPQLNAEIQGEEVLYKQYYDLGIAVGAEEGLVVPVLRDADRMSFAQIEQSIQGFIQKARDKTLTLEDLAGGTFTITNGGIFGSLMSTPMLNPPQVGILGMHRIQERPVVADGQVVVRPMMYLALTYDHRIVDGRESVQFLVRIKQLLEDPERLMLEG